MRNESQLIKVSVICHQFDIGLIKFIRRLLSSGKISVRNIIVAPSADLHPLREKQISIRKEVFGASSNSQRLNMVQLIVSFLARIGIKGLILDLIEGVSKYALGFQVIRANEEWTFGDEAIYSDMAILYSFEGLLTEKILSKFHKGIINIHPAILPEFRGLDGALWAMYEKGDIGVTAYKVDKGIDTGSIIKLFKLKKINRTLPDYILELKRLKYDSYLESILMFDANIFQNVSPKISRSQNRGVMPKKDVEKLFIENVVD